MKVKSAAQRSAVILIILILSVLCGYLYHLFGHRMDLESHPREYADIVSQYAAEYGVPEYILYGIILSGSDFQSNHVSEDGEIGLMQISPETFTWMLSVTRESLDAGILYDPDTNIRYGTYLLSYWFTEYNRWHTVIAMYLTDEDTVAEWMQDPDNIDANGNLVRIPDESVAEKVESVEAEIEMYRSLYYES